MVASADAFEGAICSLVGVSYLAQIDALVLQDVFLLRSVCVCLVITISCL